MMPPVDTRIEVIAPIVLSCLNILDVSKFLHIYRYASILV